LAVPALIRGQSSSKKNAGLGPAFFIYPGYSNPPSAS